MRRRDHADRREFGREFRSRRELERDRAHAPRGEERDEVAGGDVLVVGRGEGRDAATVAVVGHLWGSGEVWGGHDRIRLVLVSTVEAGAQRSSMRNIYVRHAREERF